MKKLIFPILLGIFALFFSGKPTSIKICGPHITIDNFAGLGVMSVEVIYNTGQVTTYNNPTFPLYHGSTDGNGGQYGVRFNFERESDGVIYVNDTPIVNFREKEYEEVWFNAFCEEYLVYITN